MIMPVAISHGDLAIEIQGAAKTAKPARIAELQVGSSVAELVKALNMIGVHPKDLTAIFQTLKEVGALQASLEIM
jgi:flagellar P-ring protein precursor FlgI